MPFLLAEILNFQGSTHRIGVGSFRILYKEITFYLKVTSPLTILICSTYNSSFVPVFFSVTV